MNWYCSSEYRLDASNSIGLTEYELYLYLLPAMYCALDCADEARLLIRELGI